MTGVRNWPSFFLGQLSLHNSENKEVSREAVCHITECSPQLHALINTFHVEIQYRWFAVSFVLLKIVFCFDISGKIEIISRFENACIFGENGGITATARRGCP